MASLYLWMAGSTLIQVYKIFEEDLYEANGTY